jgi:hypothetical protein
VLKVSKTARPPLAINLNKWKVVIYLTPVARTCSVLAHSTLTAPRVSSQQPPLRQPPPRGVDEGSASFSCRRSAGNGTLWPAEANAHIAQLRQTIIRKPRLSRHRREKSGALSDDPISLEMTDYFCQR